MTDRNITMMSGLAVRKAFDDAIFAAFEQSADITVNPIFDPTVQLLRRIEGGEHFDVLIGATPSFDELITTGVVAPGTLAPVVRTGIGFAVAPGTEHPVVATRESLIETLSTARSVAYSRTGQSGIYFVELVERLGLSHVVLPKATVLEKGFTATALLTGEADLAVQQLSELMFVPGVEIVGPLPEELQRWTEFSVGIAAASAGNPHVRVFVDYITSVAVVPAYVATALEPAYGEPGSA